MALYYTHRQTWKKQQKYADKITPNTQTDVKPTAKFNKTKLYQISPEIQLKCLDQTLLVAISAQLAHQWNVAGLFEHNVHKSSDNVAIISEFSSTYPASPNDRLPVPAFGDAVFAAESKSTINRTVNCTSP